MQLHIQPGSGELGAQLTAHLLELLAVAQLHDDTVRAFSGKQVLGEAQRKEQEFVVSTGVTGVERGPHVQIQSVSLAAYRRADQHGIPSRLQLQHVREIGSDEAGTRLGWIELAPAAAAVV